MKLADSRVVITGAGRDMGRTLSICFAQAGAEVFLSARDLDAANRVRDELAGRGFGRVHAYHCDLCDPTTVEAFARAVRDKTDHVDVVINNAAGWLEGALEDASDVEIVNTIASGSAGLVLMVKHFLPLLLASGKGDIVNLVSSSGLPNELDCRGHAAFYASKGGQGRAAQVLSHRLHRQGIRVMSLYPPDFENMDPFSERWLDPPRGLSNRLTAKSIVECIFFAVQQPRDCSIRTFEFESH